MRIGIRLADKKEYKEEESRTLSLVYDDEPNTIVLVTLPNIIQLLSHETLHYVITKLEGLEMGKKYDNTYEYRSESQWIEGIS